MPKRFTVTEKWDDVWFTGLTISQKVLWLYICDRCDCAGFWEINLALAAFQSGIPPEKIQGAFEGLIRGYHVSTDERYVWLRNFVKHQGNLPLNETNNCHVGIINRFKEQKQRFNASIDDFQRGLLAPSKGLASYYSCRLSLRLLSYSLNALSLTYSYSKQAHRPAGKHRGPVHRPCNV